jgi:hypothetical protein
MTQLSPVTDTDLLPCQFCGSDIIDPKGWATLPEYANTPEERFGPACDDCGATAPSMAVWNNRRVSHAQHTPPASPENGLQPLYVKRWRTIIMVPAAIKDEVAAVLAQENPRAHPDTP